MREDMPLPPAEKNASTSSSRDMERGTLVARRGIPASEWLIFFTVLLAVGFFAAAVDREIATVVPPGSLLELILGVVAFFLPIGVAWAINDGVVTFRKE